MLNLAQNSLTRLPRLFFGSPSFAFIPSSLSLPLYPSPLSQPTANAEQLFYLLSLISDIATLSRNEQLTLSHSHSLYLSPLSFSCSGPQLLGADTDTVPHPDALRQHSRHPIRLPGAVAANGYELLYSIIGYSRSAGRRRRNAICCLFSGK